MPEPETDETEAVEETTEEADTPDEQPEIDDDQMADFSAVADQVEAEAGATADDEDEGEDDGDDLALDPDDDRTSIGDVYCNVLGMGAAVARDQYGSLEDRDRKDVLDEYAEIARDLDIDDAVDDWIDQHGGPDQLSPGQTILVMTVVWGGMVVMDDPAILENLGGDE